MSQFFLDCDETLKGFEKELKLLGGWNEHAKKLKEDLEATQGVNINDYEREDEIVGWRGKETQTL